MDADRIYVGNSGRGSRRPLVAVAAGASGKITMNAADRAAGRIVWIQNASGPGMASPVAIDGRVYVVSRGILSCHDAGTGKRLYRTRLPGASSIAASLCAVDGKLLVLDESGTTFVVKPGETFQLIAKNSLPGLFWSTPMITQNAFLLRSADRIYCVRKSNNAKDGAEK